MKPIFPHTLILTILLTPLAAHAGGVPPISPDRPGFTNGSDTVVPGLTQLEMGIAQTDFAAASGGGHAIDYPEALVRHGLTPNLELRAALPDYTHQDGTPSGYGDASLGVKYKFFQSRDGNTKAALTPAVSLPTGGAQHGTGQTDPSLTLAAQTASGARWGLSANLALADPTQNGGRSLQTAPSVSASYQLTPALSTYGELYDNFPQHGGSAPIADGGFTFASSANLQYDLEMGVGLGSAAPIRFFGGGVSVRF
ncbi:hypothetical protein CCAX7_005500 [Capsulimonas corticalis]|uniref:Uncharacterized protein n=1 Tax=Capsulimonas corticalis TaxID=2219043 RepID=A0A402D3D9_9BACT|nr:transporter [Capsulimonas corticalis]BDI28499.1 hypothetical protein CCAX7_005500 [Capsulimonas corticalis]